MASVRAGPLQLDNTASGKDTLVGVRTQPSAFNIPGKQVSKSKMTVFWDVVSCSLVEIHRRFRGAYHRHHFPDVGGSKLL
jgi:hypothetical protein